MPEVSVILPVYNSEAFLKECIDSILAQTFKNFELIIIDDGSSDRSVEIIKSYKDNRIILLQNDSNRGIINSLNRGIEVSSSGFIARMDADDIALPERLQIQYEYLKKNPETGIIGSSVQFFGEISRIRHSFKEDEALRPMILFRNPFHHPTVMFRKELLVNHQLKYESDFYLAEDYALWIRMSFVTRFRNIPDPLIRYRIHPKQETRKNLPAMEASILKAQNILFEKLAIQLSPKEEEITIRLYTGNYIPEPSFLNDVEQWLNKLISHNRTQHVFNHAAFEKTMGRIWFLVCTSLASRKIYSHKAYFESGLHNYYSPGFMLKVRFYLKNAFISNKR